MNKSLATVAMQINGTGKSKAKAYQAKSHSGSTMMNLELNSS